MDCVYIVLESGNFCPRSLLIPVSIIAEYENLRVSIEKLLKECVEVKPDFFVYTRNSGEITKCDPSETDRIASCLEFYGDDTPSKWRLLDDDNDQGNTGFPPLFVNGWLKLVWVDVYRKYRYNIDTSEIKAKVVKTILVTRTV